MSHNTSLDWRNSLFKNLMIAYYCDIQRYIVEALLWYESNFVEALMSVVLPLMMKGITMLYCISNCVPWLLLIVCCDFEVMFIDSKSLIGIRLLCMYSNCVHDYMFIHIFSTGIRYVYCVISEVQEMPFS